MVSVGHMTGLTPTGGRLADTSSNKMKNRGWFKGLALAVFAMVLLFGASPELVAQITNPSFTGISDTAGVGFNLGLGLSVAAGIALLVTAYFFRAARRR